MKRTRRPMKYKHTSNASPPCPLGIQSPTTFITYFAQTIWRRLVVALGEVYEYQNAEWKWRGPQIGRGDVLCPVREKLGWSTVMFIIINKHHHHHHQGRSLFTLFSLILPKRLLILCAS